MFEDAYAFKQLLCSTHWQKSKGLFALAKSDHSRVLCCNAGSHLKVDPLSTGDGHGNDVSTSQFITKWTMPDDEACKPCPRGEYSESLNVNKNCTPAARDQFVPAEGMNKPTNCSENAGPNSFTNPPNSTLCEICPAGYKMIRGILKTTCAKCDAGQFQDEPGITTCNNCSSGEHQPENGTAFCLPCNAGLYQSEEGQPSCTKCPKNNYTDQSKQTACKTCFGKEQTSDPGSTFCFKCDAGQFMSTNKVCTPCALGTVSTYGQSSCSDCTAGYYSNADNSTCDACDPGKYSHETRADDSSTCRQCPVGTYSSAKGVNNVSDCNLCTPGQYSGAPGNNKACFSCPNGWLQTNQGQDHCIQPESNAIVGPGGASQQEVAEGWVKDACNSDGSHCTSSKACKPGTISTLLRNACANCDAGQTSFKGATTCSPCAKGKYTDETGSLCANCPTGFYQSQETKPSQRCLKCPTGWKQEDEGASLCIDPGGIKPENCGDDEYWVPDKFPDKDEKSQAGCNDCPDGGSCIGAIGKEGIRALFGWSKCPNLNLTYSPCKFGAACNGAANEILRDKYRTDEGDPAMKNQNESCSIAYKNNSFLCSACADKFSHSGLGDKCDACPTPAANNAIAVAGVVAGIGGLFVYVLITLSDEGKIDPADGAKSIGLSYVQIISLLTTFPIAWPDIFVSIFRIGGAVGKVLVVVLVVVVVFMAHSSIFFLLSCPSPSLLPPQRSWANTWSI